MVDAVEFPDWAAMTTEQIRRWDEVLNRVTAAVMPGPRFVVVDSVNSGYAVGVADRLAGALRLLGQHCLRLTDATPVSDKDDWRTECGPRTIALADGSRWYSRPPGGGWGLVIRLRTRPHQGATNTDLARDAGIVIDLHDPAWPVIRHIDENLADRRDWYINETRAFFAVRAATWDIKFGDDLPAYAQAVSEVGIDNGAVAIDVGCGTGRALPALRAAVGPEGTVIGIDITEQMLAAARDHGRASHTHLILADAQHLPLPDATVDVVFTAGLIGHLPDVLPGLTELARVTATGGRLALFHPSGRARLAARHGRTLEPDEPLAEGPLRDAMARTGWCLDRYDDPPHRFLALATREPRT
jgi:SAM-dependent methyltransferase